MSDDDLSTSHVGGTWTRAEDYVRALAQRRTARKSRAPRARTQPESPLFSLSTLPFLLLIVAIAVLAAAIIVTAWPRTHPTAQKPIEKRQVGTAAKGWFDEAKRDFHD